MKFSTPPDVQTLFEVFNKLRWGGEATDTALSSLIRGLISPSHAQGFYTAFASVLQISDKLQASDIINLINDTLREASGGQTTKGEKTQLARARLLALGALVRSKKLEGAPAQELNSVLEELVSYCERKEALSGLATPFILSFLELVPGRTGVSLAPIENLLFSGVKKVKNATLLQIALKSWTLDLKVDVSHLESMDNIINPLLRYISPDDAPILRSLFKFLTKTGKLELFWTTLTPRLRRTHLPLLVSCIEAAVGQECEMGQVFSREIVTFLLATFQKGDLEDHEIAKKGVKLLLNWAPPEETEGTDDSQSSKNPKIVIVLNRKMRKQALKNLFEGVPNILHEYKHFKPQLQHLLNSLSMKELDQVVLSTEANQESGSAGERLQICCQNFRCLIASSKKVSLGSKVKIIEGLFKNGFCRRAEEEEGEPANPEEIKLVRTRAAFTTLLGQELEDELVDQLFGLVHDIATGKDAEWRLVNPLGPETRDMWLKAAKLSTPHILAHKLLKLHLVVDLIQFEPGANRVNDGLEVLREICEGEREGDEEETPNKLLAELILQTMLLEDNPIVVNYEPMLKKLFQDQAVVAKNLGMATEILDPDEEGEGEAEEEDDSEEGDEEEALEFEADEEMSDSDIEYDAGDTNLNLEPAENGADAESDSSLDMDEATEEDLQRMDAALAKVFRTKKKVQNSVELDIQRFMRACRVLELTLRTVRTPDAALVPLILMPTLSCLVKCSKKQVYETGRRGAVAAQKFERVAKVVGKVNALRGVKRAEDLEEEILQGMKEDIAKFLKGKLDKGVRKMLLDAVGMLKKCFEGAGVGEDEEEEGEAPSKGAIMEKKQKMGVKAKENGGKRRKSAPAAGNGVANPKKKRKSAIN